MEKFENIVRKMTAYEIIMSMVMGLTHPTTDQVNMDSFGMAEGVTCYGCAATNTIARIAGVKFTPSNIGTKEKRSAAVNGKLFYFQVFEEAIDKLRKGHVAGYNELADGLFAKINDHNMRLPSLGNMYRVKDLEPYKELAKLQLTTSIDKKWEKYHRKSA